MAPEANGHGRMMFTDILRSRLAHPRTNQDDDDDDDEEQRNIGSTHSPVQAELETLLDGLRASLRQWRENPRHTQPIEYARNISFANPLLTRRVPSPETNSWLGDDDVDMLPPDAFDESPPALPPRNLNVSIETLHEGQGRAITYNRDWLVSQCEAHIASHVESDAMTAVQLCTDLFGILRSNAEESSLQNALVDLLGFSNFEFVSSVVLHRAEIVNTIVQSAAERFSDDEDDYKKPPTESEKPAQVVRPSYGTQVTIMSEDDKKLAKLAKKENRKKKRLAVDEVNAMSNASLLGFDGEHLRQAREAQLRLAASAPQVLDPNSAVYAPQEVFPHVYQSGSGGSMLSAFGTKFTLPVGSERKDYKEHEEISIPFSKPAPLTVGEKLVFIDTLDEWSKRAFKGYTSLNRVQSIVFPVAYQTNENMLICAPTGAGKTDVAMLTVLRTLQQYRKDGHLLKNDFKIVYVAPMKALAAEIVRKFSSRLGAKESEGGLGLVVKELTGDMQLTRAEIGATQMIVTTPEKWDVVTRKSVGDTELAQKVRLLIIDEVHLLHDDRGAVIESIVARTLRQVESTQSLIRIVGLSATLPNYVDVARVNPYQGLFYFDSGFRPVPLAQHFVGVKGRAGGASSLANMNHVTYDKVLDKVKDKHQVMVFVHSRKDTVKTSYMLRDEAVREGKMEFFDPSYDTNFGLAVKDISKSKNREMKELFAQGFGIHHAGMLRSDRNMMEKYFEKGFIRVLCCTATLAWGVNLPAFAVIIKGTQVYDSAKGKFIDLSILDVLQIFGRAGRPQYEDHGDATIVTSHDKLSHYVSAMTQQHPIESQFATNMTDNLNAEISLGTVTNLDEAVKWLSYTYLYVRMKKNPFHYGLEWQQLQDDPLLGSRRRELIISASKSLHKAQMIVFDERTGYLTPKDLGRTASSFYIRSATIEVFNTMMRPRMSEADVLSMISMSSEFENIRVREEEMTSLQNLEQECVCAVKGSVDTNYGKSNILLQAYVSKLTIEEFALVSDTAYVAQNAARILRACFEIALNRSWGPTAAVILSLSKSVDRRMWSFEHPLAQFDLPMEIIQKMENSPKIMTLESMRDMDVVELGNIIRHNKMAPTVAKCVDQFPTLYIEASVAPITRTVLRVTLYITPDFTWNDRVHGTAEPWWIWIEDAENVEILHSEYFLLTKRQQRETQKLGFTIPLPSVSSTTDGLPPQIFVRAISDKWIGAECVVPISFKHLILPSLQASIQTDLLDLSPLPVSALQNPVLEAICEKRFDYFNAVQTQIFHTLYHTDHNALVGAPTGSGKTVAAELAMWATFRDNPTAKVVYIAPLKALVRERVSDWRARLTGPMNRRLVELTGDVTPDLRTIEEADIIITTPEKWDGISRSWKSRSYVTSVGLVIIDEIHLLGGERGPILEIIVSRMNYIASQTQRKVRIVGLSTALANAHDLGDWLGIKHVGLFNFRHSVRPVPLDIYIEGYPGKHYCPRMMSMNKPTYAAIMTHSPTKPVIVFVSSRRQTRLTAQDLISLCAADDNPRRFLKISENDLDNISSQIRDPALRLSLSFGIGLHHAGLVDSDRKTVEELFVNNKIQILIATSTLAWGVNFPAHLVVVKGTEFFDAKKHAYVDFPITDVLQMMGRAGRPQFDDSGVAVILVHDVKKNFYKKFLHEPFPVESSLHSCLHDHFNAEIVSGTIKSKQDAVDFLTWTYFYRRLPMNPTYYGLETTDAHSINIFLSGVVEKTITDLAEAGCCDVQSQFFITPTVIGRIASYYYLQYRTVDLLRKRLTRDYRATGRAEDHDGDFSRMMRILSDVSEYDEHPVRHNEDHHNQEMEAMLPVHGYDPLKKGQSSFGGPRQVLGYDSPHLKVFLLMQAHLTRMTSFPIADYATDLVSVLDQSIRVMQAMVDVSADQGYLATTKGVMKLMQCIKQARWPTDSTLLTLPRITPDMISSLQYKKQPVTKISQLLQLSEADITNIFKRIPSLSPPHIQDIVRIITSMPSMNIRYRIDGTKQLETGEIVLKAGESYTIKIEAARHRPYRSLSGSNVMDYRTYTPKFPKPQYEGWWALLCEPDADELIGIKRVSPSGSGRGAGDTEQGVAPQRVSKDGRLSTSVEFTVPDEPGTRKTFGISLMSDAYLGLDVHVRFDIAIV
ncbi:hypothetical protein SmJEL517_g04845 [Synchytrium microbalum]|uniref:Uncharacterized protein n=1 Tax=Synchytrium microbalum TaxID=1806994 RepID=A0A507C342_9FUNG|nr:uncharacterized protein SmJEL517_g04845 [Synchytrium microbalum]TPX31933.1 hypothetical protein SmJEL517_g04845 [Synchytrium microbalum]